MAIKKKPNTKPAKKKQKAKAKKDKYIPKKGLLGNAVDYHVHKLSKTDRLLAFTVGFLAGAIVMALFFSNLVVSVIGGVIAGCIAPGIYNSYKKEKKTKQLRLQFKDLLESLATSYSAGLNTTKAFEDARKDMANIYGEDSDICREVEIICMGINSNLSIEKLLLDWAERSDIDDITSFAEVFEVCVRQGSDLRRIVSDTRDIISDKVEVEMEIDTILSGSKNELNIMIAMPLLVVGLLRFMGGITISDNTPANIAIKAVCLALFIGAYVIGRKITKIKI